LFCEVIFLFRSLFFELLPAFGFVFQDPASAQVQERAPGIRKRVDPFVALVRRLSPNVLGISVQGLFGSPLATQGFKPIK
jgi:hypothetical protein